MTDLAEVEDAMRTEFDQLTDPAMGGDELTQERDRLRGLYDEQASTLSKHRRKHAKALSKAVTAAMQGLNMSGGVFRINVDSDSTEPHVHGNDVIEFLVSPNPGVKPAALAKVASGGELSRISLCLSLATLGSQSVPTLVFDEVDSGIGGAVAETVGRLLRQVGSQSQVLCVTHLPQVAAQAHHHLLISKSVSKGKTRTAVETLTAKGTRDEIARMLGGAKITAKTRNHAQEMLDSVDTVPS